MIQHFRIVGESGKDEKLIQYIILYYFCYLIWLQSKDHKENMLRKTFKRSSIVIKVVYDLNTQRNYYHAVLIFTTK